MCCLELLPYQQIVSSYPAFILILEAQWVVRILREVLSTGAEEESLQINGPVLHQNLESAAIPDINLHAAIEATVSGKPATCQQQQL